MPGGKSCERRRLDPPAPTRLSPAEDRGARCSSHQALLLVVELDVRLVQQRDREVEREVAVRALEEREARVPAMQVAVQGDHAPVRPARDRPGPRLASLARELLVLQEPERQLRVQLHDLAAGPAGHQVRLRAAEPGAMSSALPCPPPVTGGSGPGGLSGVARTTCPQACRLLNAPPNASSGVCYALPFAIRPAGRRRAERRLPDEYHDERQPAAAGAAKPHLPARAERRSEQPGRHPAELGRRSGLEPRIL